MRLKCINRVLFHVLLGVLVWKAVGRAERGKVCTQAPHLKKHNSPDNKLCKWRMPKPDVNTLIPYQLGILNVQNRKRQGPRKKRSAISFRRVKLRGLNRQLKQGPKGSDKRNTSQLLAIDRNVRFLILVVCPADWSNISYHMFVATSTKQNFFYRVS